MLIFAAPAAYVFYDIAINDESIGFAGKAETDSYYDRAIGVQNSLNAFYENPFGYGQGNSKYGPLTGINLIAALGAIGFIGFLLHILNWIVAVASVDARRRKFECVLPFIITALTSQPIADAPFVLIMNLFRPAKK